VSAWRLSTIRPSSKLEVAAKLPSAATPVTARLEAAGGGPADGRPPESACLSLALDRWTLQISPRLKFLSPYILV
jgi:hypothetical protein